MFVLFTSSVVVNRNLIGLIVIPLRLAKHLAVGFTHLSINEPSILDLFGYINTETTSSFLDLFDIGQVLYQTGPPDYYEKIEWPWK